jgi:hypothetical protein
MPVRPNPVEALANLTRVEDASKRRASWRQAIAALGHRAGLGLEAAPPLEGMAQGVIARAAETAIELGLADDLDWLAPGPATVALYELTAALPPGKTRRDLGRRVFARLYQGTAATFAAVATRMALTSSRPFEPATLRARVSLLFDLPIGSNVNADTLALTLVTRRELRERWLEPNKTGTLPARRLAAKLLEHAAREAMFRFQQGDLQPRELLLAEPIRGTMAALLADREPLVWRHVAVARGLLAVSEDDVRQDIELSLDPALSPTEWRRGAVSLVAMIVNDPEYALRACRKVIEGPIGELDRGIASALVLGLPRVIEAEPDAAEELLGWLAATRRPDVAEAVAALLSDLHHPKFAEKAARTLRQALAARTEGNAALRAIRERALQKLDRQEDERDLLGLVKRALVAYETSGAREAFELATEAVRGVSRAMDFVAINDPHDEQTLPYVLAALNDIDAAVLERPRLTDLLLLGRRPGETDVGVPEMDKLYDRLGRWLLTAQSSAGERDGANNALAIGEQRRLRALLHLMDVDCTRQEDDKKVQARVSRALAVLIARVSAASASVIHRIACAALARACDAGVREGLGEPADLLLLLASTLTDPTSYRAIAEASTNPDVRGVVSAYADFISAPAESMEGSEPPGEVPSQWHGRDDALGVAERIVRLSRGLGAGGAYRGEALRRIVLRLGRALEAVAHARGQSELVDSSGAGTDPLGDLEAALDDLQRLARGATRRLIGEDPSDIAVVTEVASVSALVERAVRGGVPANQVQFDMAVRELVASVPAPLGGAVSKVLARLPGLPIAVQSDVFAIPLERRRTQLPDWLLPHRTVGAFYVVRSLGSGGASSVFLARRVEQRNNAKAEGFALKVPDYDPTTARSLSEEEFLQLFREEAGALLSLPEHKNLAHFVTFDAGARPKPILVMELIRGTSLDRLIRSRSLTSERALNHIDGILAGLEAMHGAGVGHLDVKPSNVILRDGEVPVLVDFGLSGRHLRPGCGTIDYSAPEVLGAVPDGYFATPQPTDMYAFGCLAFEAMTATLLFDGEDETEVLAGHLAHDGWPARLTPFAHTPETADFAKFIAACVRRDPRNRPTASQGRSALRRIVPGLARSAWPLSAQVVRRAAG